MEVEILNDVLLTSWKRLPRFVKIWNIAVRIVYSKRNSRREWRMNFLLFRPFFILSTMYLPIVPPKKEEVDTEV